MFYKQRFALIFALALLAFGMLLTACGNTTSTGSDTTPTAAPANTPEATPTTASSGSTAIIKTASATVDGKSVTILTDAKGMTLYYRTSDTATSVCTGGCAAVWPPLIFSGSGTPTGETSLPGTLSVSNNANGAQVAYQGHLLYTYAKDTAAGQVTGQNVGNVWFVATTDLQSADSSSGAETPTPSYGSGY